MWCLFSHFMKLFLQDYITKYFKALLNAKGHLFYNNKKNVFSKIYKHFKVYKKIQEKELGNKWVNFKYAFSWPPQKWTHQLPMIPNNKNILDNCTHYTISQSTVWYDTQLTNDSLTTLIVFRCRNYSDSFFSYVHLFSDIPSNDNAFSIGAGFTSNRIGRVYVHSTNMADLIFFHKTLTFRTII